MNLRTDPLLNAIKKENKKLIAASTKIPFKVGENYLVRTVTVINIGKLKSIAGQFLVFEHASWIGDTGRFSECLTNPNILQEIEPFSYDVFINSAAIVDATLYPFTLPLAAK